jgi:uncharacterized membrane protein
MTMSSPTRAVEGSFLLYLKATIVGGLLFLLPMVVVAAILGYALKLATKVSKPIIDLLPDAWLGTGMITIVAAILIMLISLSAGLFARTRTGKGIMDWLENSMLGGLPQYQLVKSMAEGLAHVESAQGVTPALISIEGGWQMGYLLEKLDSGWVAVFLPQSPTPMSGNVMYLPAERVRPLLISMVQAMSIIKRLGVGSGKALRGVNFSLPEGA